MLKEHIASEMKAAMKAGDKRRLGVLRLVLAALKQVEVDERIELDDSRIIAILDKMVKQRRDSVAQYQQAGRDDLAGQESFEIEVIQEFMPQPLSEEEIDALIEEAVGATGAGSMKEMGKVMGFLKPRLQGRADMGAVSAKVKQKLSA